MIIQNFGRNVNFQPQAYYEPDTEAEILEILNKHKHGQIRVQGSLHAWNPGVVSQDAFLDIKNLDSIRVIEENGKKYVMVGGGCKVEKLVLTLASQNLMVPTLGAMMKQSVAGIVSTATHGSGRPSFSHYVDEIRMANYDPETGNAKVITLNSGDELRAARTSLGCMGVILSLKIPCVERYYIEELSTTEAKTIDEALAAEAEWPLQAFGLIPHSWQILSFRRKIVPYPRNQFRSALLRLRDIISIEFTPHLLLKLALMFRSSQLILAYYRFLPKLLWKVRTINEDYKALTLHTRRHYKFRHVETEIFVPEKHIKAAFQTIKDTVYEFAKDGQYTLHYTIFFRKVFPDDSMIGMTAGSEAYYAIGFFTYDEEKNRDPYYKFVTTLAKTLNKLYDARLHWGKSFPLIHEDIARLYPELEKFKSICKKYDPNGVFQNDFTKRIFGS